MSRPLFCAKPSVFSGAVMLVAVIVAISVMLRMAADWAALRSNGAMIYVHVVPVAVVSGHGRCFRRAPPRRPPSRRPMYVGTYNMLGM